MTMGVLSTGEGATAVVMPSIGRMLGAGAGAGAGAGD